MTSLVLGWSLLCGSGGLRAVIALGSAAATATLADPDPLTRLARHDPELAGEGAVNELACRDDLGRLELQLAPALLAVAVAGAWGALRLLRREPRSRALLVAVGLASLAISGAHAWRSMQIHTAEAAGLPAAEEALPAFYAVAGIQLCLQSLPLILAMSLLRHPLVRHYLASGPHRPEPASLG